MMREAGSCLLFDDMGPQPVDTPILTPDGWSALGALKPGDVVFNLHGEATPVRAVKHFGAQPVYRVVFNDRTSTLATGNHRWKVYTHNDRKRNNNGRVLSTDQLRESGLKQRCEPSNAQYFLPQQPVIDLPGKTFFGLSPYAYGALLGDGSLCGEQLSITCPDDYVIDRVVRSTRRLGTSGRRDQPEGGRCQSYWFHRNGKLRTELASLGACVRAEHKSVHPFYLSAHVGARRALLAGLLDTDGTVIKTGAGVEFSSASPQLSRDVAWLGRSLGAVVTESDPQPAGYRGADGNHVECQDKHRVLLRFPADGPNPFEVPRKADAWARAAATVQRRRPPRTFQSIEPAGKAEVCCIELDTDDDQARVYLTDTALIPTHNTGKSVSTVLGLVERAAQRHPVLPVVVVCPASVMDSWVDHFRDWAPFWRVIAWRGSPQRRRRLMGTADIYVCSYGTAVRDAPGQLDKDGKRIKSRPLLELGPCAVVSDELHKIKGNATAQSHAVRRMAEQVHQRSGIFVGLSGTPITHSPGDAWPGLYCLEPGANPSKDRWVMRYCQFKREEYSVTATGFAQHREPEFRLTVLGQNRRVSKADVLTELPPKMWTQRWVDIPTKYRQAYDDMAEDMLAQLPDTGEELKVFAILDQLNRLQSMASSSGTVRYTEEEVLNAETGEWETKRHTHLDMRRPSWKVDELIEIMREREGRPVVTFAHSSQLMRMAGEQATEEGYRVGYIIGGQSAKERTRNVKAFQAGELDLICVTTGAGGVGITLTRSDCCVFLQRPWSLVEATQSEDRLHRIGAERHESIEIIDVLARNSVDSRVRSVLKDRAGQLSDFVQDPRIVAEILGGAEVRQLRKAG
jgi:hypothetical protein